MADGIFESLLTATAAELLAEVGRARTRRQAAVLFEQFLVAGSRSEEDFQASFLAAQMLRDHAIINAPEAAYAFEQLIARARVEWLGSHGSLPDFYRARGEHITATILEENPRKCRRYARHGRMLLVDTKTVDGDDVMSSSALAAIIEQRVRAGSAGVTRKEQAIEWRALLDALKDASVLVAVRTVRSLREGNALSASHATLFIDRAIRETVDRLWDRDPDLRDQWNDVRACQIKADCLRWLGERDLAKLLLTDPEAYEERLNHHWPPRGELLPLALELQVEEALMRMEEGGVRRGDR